MPAVVNRLIQTKPKPWHGKIEPQHLRNPDDLVRLAGRAAAAGFVPEGREGQVIVAAAAHVAIHATDIKDPAGMFVAIVENRNHCREIRLKPADLDRGRAMIDRAIAVAPP